MKSSKMLLVILLSLLFLFVFGGAIVLSSSLPSSTTSAIESDAAIPRLSAATITTDTVSLSGRLALDVDAVLSSDGSKAAVPVVGPTAGPGIGKLDIINLPDGAKTSVPLRGDIMPGVDPITWTIGGAEAFLMPTEFGLEQVDVASGAHQGLLATWPSRLRSDVDLALSPRSASGADGTALMPMLDALHVIDLGSGVSTTLPITGGLVPGMDIVFEDLYELAMLPTVGNLHVIDVMAQKVAATIPLTGTPSAGRLRPDVDARFVKWGFLEYTLLPSMDGVYVIDILNASIERVIPLPSDLVIGSDLAPLEALDPGNTWAIMPTVNHLTLFDWNTGASTTLNLPGRVRSNIDVLIESQSAFDPSNFVATIPVVGAQNWLVRVAVDTSVPSLTILEQLPLPGDVIPAVDATDIITGGKHYLVMPTNGNLSIFNTTDAVTTTLTGGMLRDDVDVLVNPNQASDVILPTEGQLFIARDVPPASAVLPTQGALYVVDIAGGSVRATIPLQHHPLMMGVDAVGTDNFGFYGTSYFHVDEDIPLFAPQASRTDHKVIDTTDHAALIRQDDGRLAMVDELDGSILGTLGPVDFDDRRVMGQITLDPLNQIGAVQLEDHSLALIDLPKWHYYGVDFTRVISRADLGGYKLRNPVFASRQGLLLAEMDNDSVAIINSFNGDVTVHELPAPSRSLDVDSLNGYARVWLADGSLEYIDLWDPEFPSFSWRMDDMWVWDTPTFDYVNGYDLVYVWDGLGVNLAVVDMVAGETAQIIPLPARPTGRMTFDYTNKIGVIMLDNHDVFVVDLFGAEAASYTISEVLPAPLAEYRWYGSPPRPVIDPINKILLVNMWDGNPLHRYLFLFDLLTGEVINVLGDDEESGCWSEPIWGAGYPDRIYFAGDKKIALVTRSDGDVVVLDLWRTRWHWWDNGSSWNWPWCCWYWYQWYAADFWGFGSGWQVDTSRGIVFDCLNDHAILQVEKGNVHQVVVIDLLAPCFWMGHCEDCFGPWGEGFFNPPWPVGFGGGIWWDYSVRSDLYLDYWDKRVDFFVEDQPWDVTIVPDTHQVITTTLNPPPLIVADTTTPTITSTLVSAVATGGPSPTSTLQLVRVTGRSGAVDDGSALLVTRNFSNTFVPPAVTLARPGSPPGFEAYIYGDVGDTICVSANDAVGNATDYEEACVTVKTMVYLPLVFKDYE